MNNSARRVLEILELFADSATPMTISDITAATGYPKTSVFDIVGILHDKGFIRRDNDRAKTYVIGVKAYQVGMTYLQHTNLYSLAHPLLTELRDRLGETCYLAVEEKGSIIYLDKLESDAPIRASCNIGSKNFLHLTGLGKAILAAWPEEKVRAVCPAPLEVHTPNTIPDPETLLRVLEETRIRGYAQDLGEDNPYIRCVAAPVLDTSGAPCAAISISMLSDRFTPEMEQKAAAQIIEAALYLSRQMGYRGSGLYQ
ncbi:MAG: IclR family transcriptional regulator [Clostridia bacterium]|nr:IclR family transcriptional regulator [Clostridia bacterium]